MSDLPHLLIVDASRVVRVSLAKNLKQYFEIREEDNAEFAWETLILDSSIVAVVCGLSLPKMDGIGLLEKIRSNKLARLRNLPFFLIASDSMLDEVRGRALAAGASGFVPKGLGTAETQRVASELLESCRQGGGELLPVTLSADDHEILDTSDVFGKVSALSSAATLSPSENDMPAASGQPAILLEVVSRGALAQWSEQMLACDAGKGIGVLMIALDDYAVLVDDFGREMADRIENRFVQLLARKLSAGDRIAKVSADRIAVLVAEGGRQRCSEFARKLCARIAQAAIAVRGERIDMSLSIGVACQPDDAEMVSGSEDLLALAEERLELAARAGGNQVVAESERLPGGGHEREQVISWLTDMLNHGTTAPGSAHLGEVGLLIMPVLRQMEHSFALGLPIDRIESRLKQTARAECS